MSKKNAGRKSFLPVIPREFNSLFFINAGCQMESKRGISILDQALVFISIDQEVNTGDIAFVVLKGSENIIRQVIFSPDRQGVTLRCLNDKYPDVRLNREDIKIMMRIYAYLNPSD